MDREQYEEQFRRAGLPLLIVDRDASKDIWTRAAGLLALIFWVEFLGAVDLTWPWWANVLTLIGGLSLLAAAWVIANRARGRTAFERPKDIGTLELAGFVVIPGLIPLIFNQQWVSALVTMAGNLIVLALIYAVTVLGLVSILRWAGRRLFGQLAGSLALIARALPLLMLFSVVLFMTAEVWQVFADMGRGNLTSIAVLLVLVGALFLFVRLPREVDRIAASVGDDAPPLSSAQRFNVGLVLFVSQSLQVLLVTISVGLFFALFGMITVTARLTETWTGASAEVIADTRVFGVDVTITDQLIVVSGAVAVLSGLYYAIAVFTDGTYREEFLGEVTGEMRQTFAARAEYLTLIRAPVSING
ncbi:MAG: hypothetical protein JHC98_01790 [Thermoleophilaceae bacterium]|nr:hypothetical protein [Thermoleophilaceae bacterium]